VIYGPGADLKQRHRPATQLRARVTQEEFEGAIVGTPGDDVLTGTEGSDLIIGLEGNDTIVALGWEMIWSRVPEKVDDVVRSE